MKTLDQPCALRTPLDPVRAAFFWRSKAYTLLKVDVEWESKYANNPIEEFSLSSYSSHSSRDLTFLDGKRYFPGAASSSDGAYRNRINVRVSVPGYKNGKVKLRAFDVDDPTTITGVDDDSESLGDDNNELDFSLSGEFSGVVTVGTKESISLAEDSITLLLDDSGEGVAEFILSPQPGNNYRIAALNYLLMVKLQKLVIYKYLLRVLHTLAATMSQLQP